MPSDPTGRHPIGVLTRPAPDFFDDQLTVIGGQFVLIAPPVGLNYQTWAIYNNASTGVVLKVYGFTASNGGGGGLAMWFIKGTIGALQYGAVGVRPDQGASFGQLYFRQFNVPAGTLNADIPAQILGVMGASGFDSMTTVSPFPLFIIPAGYSLVGSTPLSSDNSGITAWCQQSNE